MENQEQQRSLGPFLENRRSFVLLRWLLLILASYLTLFTNIQSENISGIFVMVLMYSASNVAISLLPLRLFMAVRERRLIIVADAVFVCACLYLLQGDGQIVDDYSGETAKPYTHRSLDKDWTRAS